MTGVSIHPPLCRRGEPRLYRRRFEAQEVSIHPPLCRRGEPQAQPAERRDNRVSIHPPLCRRGEPDGNVQRSSGTSFNPPPALSVSGILVRFGTRTLRGFKPCCHGSRSAAPEACSLAAPRGGFKPCCHGSRSAAGRPGDIHDDVPMFQTLLSWKSVSGAQPDEGIHEVIPEFQTLLSWKSVSGSLRSRSYSAD